MVYFKVNTLLARVIALAKLGKVSMGCQVHCDWQVISTADLQACLRHIRVTIKELEEELEKDEKLV